MFASIDVMCLEKIQSILECRNRLSEVHDFFSNGVHCNGTRHCAGCTVLATAGLVTSFPRVMLLLNQVVSGAEGHEMRVVSRRGDGHWPSASHVRVAQLVSQALQLIRPEVVIVPEHVVVRWSWRSLYNKRLQIMF